MLAESNVIDLVAALRKSLGQPLAPSQPAAKAEKSAKRTRKASANNVRAQPALKLPLQGCKKDRAQLQTEAVQNKPAPARSGRRGA